jgi:hypothetical protein
MVGYEAFRRDFPDATSDQVERNAWKYMPDFVARARAEVHRRRLVATLTESIVWLLNKLTPKETR